MEEEEYNRIARLYQFMQFANHLIDYNYNDFNGAYKSYKVDDISFPEKTMSLINNLRYLKVSQFYTQEHLDSNKEHAGYLNSWAVMKSDNKIGFHYDLPSILFHYLLNKFKNAAIEFLKAIESPDFKERYKAYIKETPYELTYPLYKHPEIFNYFESIIQDYEVMHFHFSWLSDAIYNDGRKSYFKLQRIKNSIEALSRFEFDDINI